MMYNPTVPLDEAGGGGGGGGDRRADALTQWRESFVSNSNPNRTAVSSYEFRPEQQTSLTTEQTRVTHVVMVDSLDRDQHVYPSPTQVRLKLPRAYRNVERIDIVQIKFFCGLYTISDSLRNNMFGFTDPSGTYTVSIPNGAYGLSDLLTVIQTLMNALAPANAYAVSFNSVTGRVSFAGSQPFSMTLYRSPLPAYIQTSYSEWGLGWVLGWTGQASSAGTLSGSAVYTATAWPRLGNNRDYIFLQLNETDRMNAVDHTSLENTGAAQESTGQVSHYFGKLLMNSYGCWAQTFIESPKLFAPVLGRLERLQFTWTDRHGNTLVGPDALSCDWHMTLRITELVDKPTAN